MAITSKLKYFKCLLITATVSLFLLVVLTADKRSLHLNKCSVSNFDDFILNLKNNLSENYLDHFEKLNHLSDQVFIYSSFFYPKTNQLVIISVANRSFSQRIWCQFKDFQKTSAKLTILPEHHDLKFSAALIVCKRPETDISAKLKLKLITTSPTNRFDSDFFTPEVHREVTFTKKTDFVVCVRPFFGQFDQVKLLEQFIAYYKLNGAHLFIFYNYSYTLRVGRFLQQIPFVRVLPFKLDKNVFNNLHAEGQLVTAHDCLHRYPDNPQIHVDVDEFLFPRQNKTIKQFLSKYISNDISASVIRMTLFCREFNSPNNDDILFQHFNRQESVWPFDIRSKVIVLQPSHIKALGIHTIGNCLKRLVRVVPEEALIFHYRRCCGLLQPIQFSFYLFKITLLYFEPLDDHVIVDNSMTKYETKIKKFDFSR